MMGLPAALDKKVDAEVERIEKEKEMPYVGYEQRAEQRAMAKGGIRMAIELRFGKVTPQDGKLLDAIYDQAELNRLLRIAKKAKDIAEFRQALQAAAAVAP
jgi:hypothetical protein